MMALWGRPSARGGLSGRNFPLIVLGALLPFVGTPPLHAAPKQPVYVGARACAGCHSGKGMGNAYGKWLHSKHSRAYAALARPESKEIAAAPPISSDSVNGSSPRVGAISSTPPNSEERALPSLSGSTRTSNRLYSN